MQLTFDLLPGIFGIARLDPRAAVPAWAGRGSLTSITRTPSELSIVCAADAIPAGVRVEPGWRALAIAGPLDFSLTGVVSGFSAALAADGIPVFVISTFDTDVVLVRDIDLARAAGALRAAGHSVKGS